MRQHIPGPPHALVRYHSAPSSTLTSLLDIGNIEELDTLTVNPAINEDIEFAKFLDDHLINSMENDSSSLQQLDDSNLLAPAPPRHCHSHELPPLAEYRASSTDHAHYITRLQLDYTLMQESTLSSPSPDCGTAGLQISSTASLDNQHGIIEQESTASSTYHVMPIDQSFASCVQMGKWKAPPTASGLTRHNSSPAHVLSSLVEDKALLYNDGPALGQQTAHDLRLSNRTTEIEIASLRYPPLHLAAPYNQQKPAKTRVEDQIDQFAQAQSFCTVHPLVDQRQSGLVHQNSSPADIISHMSCGVVSPSTSFGMDLVSENSVLEDKDGGGAHRAAETVSWPDKFGLPMAKRGRDFQNMQTAQSSESTSRNSEADDNIAKASLIKSLRSTEVLCRVSAKRGYATHPRSIAERERRSKINEGIRKLQDLMPNSMGKQMTTVTMLDEAVEYVKFLQHQVEELSIPKTPRCNGSCRTRGDAYA